jgi:hypothetical protein
MAAFPYVFSIIILTFRDAWSGLYCENCRRAEMTKAKIITLLFGWWGIPFGPIYSIGRLFAPADGEVPPEVNAPYLAALGVYFLRKGWFGEARQAIAASIQYRYNPELASLLQGIPDIPTRAPQRLRPKRGATKWILGSVTAALVLLFAISSIVPDGPGPSTPVPTATRRPTKVPTPTPPPVRTSTPSIATTKPMFAVSTTNSNANIRKGPGTEHEILRTVWQGTEVHVVGYYGDGLHVWYKLDPEGWVAAELVDRPSTDVAFVKPDTAEPVWVSYTSASLGFKANIPPAFEPVEHEPEPGNPSRAITFDAGVNSGPDSIVITVIATPLLEAGLPAITANEMKRLARDMASVDGIRTVREPESFLMNDYNAVSIVTEADFADEGLTARGHMALVSTQKRFYYIEVAGLVPHGDLIQSVYAQFLAGFDFLE